MRIKESLDLQAKLVLRIKDIFGETQCFKSTLDQHLNRMNTAVWQSFEFRQIPSWRRSYLRGVSDTLFDLLYSGRESALVSVIIGPDGNRPGNDAWLAESSEYKSNMKIQYVWRAAWEQGKFMPF